MRFELGSALGTRPRKDNLAGQFKLICPNAVCTSKPRTIVQDTATAELVAAFYEL